ncbi:MAG: FtsQ-type POTRA domain-containing protein [Patescibacteria group bacterium]|nr:FtsQ-type POTRA domain-containing protein [Patescibacteria group bacterium]
MWKRRRIKKSSGIFKKILPIILILLVIVSVYFLIRSGLFSVKQVNIDVNGLECADANQLKNSAKIVNQNFFLLDSAKIEVSLKNKFFCIKSVMLSKQFPNKVKMQVLGRQPFAVLVDLKDKPASSSSLLENIATPSAGQINNSYIVDNEGVVFDNDKDNLNIPKIYTYDSNMSLGKSLTDDPNINPLKILEKVKSLGIEIQESWLNDDYLQVLGDSKLQIIFALNDKIDIQLASLQLILAEAKINSRDLEFIDLRFDKPIVKFTPKKNG